MSVRIPRVIIENSAKISFPKGKGSLVDRKNMADKMLREFFKELSNGENRSLSNTKVAESIGKNLPGNILLYCNNTPRANCLGWADPLVKNTQHGKKMIGYQFNINRHEPNTIFHEVSHVFFALTNPKYMGKYIPFFDEKNIHNKFFMKNLYHNENLGILPNPLYKFIIKHQINSHLEKTKLNNSKKINVLQFFRTSLADEKIAFNNGLKYRKKWNNSANILKGEYFFDDFGKFDIFRIRFSDKIKAINELLAETIQQERKLLKAKIKN